MDLYTLRVREKRGKERSKEKSFCIRVLIMSYMSKIKCLKYLLECSRFNIVTFAVSVLNIASLNS